MAAPTIPPGSTFFDMVKKSFTDVPVDKEHGNAVSTSEFLEASESLTTLFGTLLSLDWDSLVAERWIEMGEKSSG
jgi:hypothetical protein